MGGRQLADLVVHRTACMARVVTCERSVRPVTGAPRLGIRLVCEEVLRWRGAPMCLVLHAEAPPLTPEGPRYARCLPSLLRYFSARHTSLATLGPLGFSHSVTMRKPHVAPRTFAPHPLPSLLEHLFAPPGPALAPQAFDVDPSSLTPTDGGFLVGRAAAAVADAAGGSRGSGGESGAAGAEGGAPPTKVVCVVGLAHANGVLERCAERDLCA